MPLAPPPGPASNTGGNAPTPPPRSWLPDVFRDPTETFGDNLSADEVDDITMWTSILAALVGVCCCCCLGLCCRRRKKKKQEEDRRFSSTNQQPDVEGIDAASAVSSSFPSILGLARELSRDLSALPGSPRDYAPIVYGENTRASFTPAPPMTPMNDQAPSPVGSDFELGVDRRVLPTDRV